MNKKKEIENATFTDEGMILFGKLYKYSKQLKEEIIKRNINLPFNIWLKLHNL